MMAELIALKLIFLALAGSSKLDKNDIKLARAIKNGDHRAFKKFFDAHKETLARYLLAKGIDRPTSEDLIQKAFLYIWEKRGRIDPDKSLRAYLFRIGYTRMLNHIRDNAKFDDNQELPTVEASGNPEEKARASELHSAIEQAIKNMPEKRGLVFEMCFVQEFTYKETAEALAISPKTVENHMGLALKDLRAALAEFKPEN